MIQVNILSAGASFDFSRSNPAIAASTKVVEKDEDTKRLARQSESTLVGEDCSQSNQERINWIAGVGDICNNAPGSAYHGAKETTQQAWKHAESLEKHVRSGKIKGPHHAETQRSALQCHCDFWDADHDGLIYPWDIFVGFRKLGFNRALCLWAAVTMAFCSSYSTQANWLPHPFFAINVDNIHRSRHGSTTATYDMDAEIDMRRFDSIFDKYAEGNDYLTWKSLYNVWAGQCCANDWFGWFAGGLEWIALYILLWPKDGKLKKEDILGVFDGSIFEKIARQRAENRRL